MNRRSFFGLLPFAPLAVLVEQPKADVGPRKLFDIVQERSATIDEHGRTVFNSVKLTRYEVDTSGPTQVALPAVVPAGVHYEIASRGALTKAEWAATKGGD